MMSDVPEAIRKQTEEAEKKWQEAYGKPAETAPDDAPEDTVSDSISEPEPTAEAPDRSAYWEQRFKVVEGKYQAEVPRLAQDNRLLREELNALRQQVSQSSAKPEEADHDFKLLDDYFDKDTRKQLDTYIEKKVQQRLKDVQEAVQKTQQATAQTAEQAFWREVMRTVPDYESVSKDPEFSAWLNQSMPLTPYTRYQLMMDAYQSGSADRFVEFIQAWRGGREAQPKDQVDPALKRKAVPSRAAGSSSPSGSEKKVYSREEYAKLGDKVRQAQMLNRRDEVKRLTTEMDSVLAEGRLRA